MRKAIVIGLVAVLIGSIFGIGMIGGERDTHSMANIEVRGYTPHAPIYIHGNSDFNSKHGVVGGSGTKDDPYIIAGWEIKDKGNNEGIRIEGTTAYFVIEYCHIHNLMDGIYLYKVSHGTIIHNKISNIPEGGDAIDLDASSDNTIEYNIVSDNCCGISLSYSKNNEIHHNDFINNWIQASNDPSFEPPPNNWDYNYWSDYNGTDSDGDGYGDTPYKSRGFVDHHPLMNPVNPTVEENSPLTSGFPWLWIILGIVIVAAIIIVLAVKRKGKT